MYHNIVLNSQFVIYSFQLYLTFYGSAEIFWEFTWTHEMFVNVLPACYEALLKCKLEYYL